MITGRKFTIAMTAIAVSSALVYFKAIADSLYATIMVATITGYFTANVSQKVATAKS